MKKIFIVVFLMTATLFAADNLRQQKPEVYWDLDVLAVKPAYRSAPFADSQVDGLQAILVKGYGPAAGDKTISSHKPNPLSTKVEAEFFAYMGFPDGPVPEGGFPGVVLIHGGGGTAYPKYAKQWIAQGYAVIMADWYNRRPVPPADGGKTKTVPLDGGLRQDHVANVANMILAHTVLRSQPNVNKNKTIFVGLSWGSWYGAMLASIDTRFKAGIEIYCGDIKDNNSFINGRFHQDIKIPLYWVVGTNDKHTTVPTITKAFRTCPKVYNRSIVIELPHSHIGFEFESCKRMAAHFLKGEANLPELSDIQVKDGVASAAILDHGKGIKEAYLCYTDSTDPVYYKREWKKIPATINGNTIFAKVPENANSYYLTAYDGKSRHNTLCGSTNGVVPESQK